MSDTPTHEALRQCRDAITQLIACHDEPECPALETGRAALAAADAALSVQAEPHRDPGWNGPMVATTTQPPAPQTASEWVDTNVSGNPALVQAMKNHAEAAAPVPAPSVGAEGLPELPPHKHSRNSGDFAPLFTADQTHAYARDYAASLASRPAGDGGAALSMDDAYTLIGHAVMEHGAGKTDMPVFFAGLAARIAELVADKAHGERMRETFREAVIEHHTLRTAGTTGGEG